jgi:hypothetical protein
VEGQIAEEVGGVVVSRREGLRGVDRSVIKVSDAREVVQQGRCPISSWPWQSLVP